MKPEELKPLIDSVDELSESYAELAQALKGTTQEAKRVKQLWRTGKRSWLIKMGLALIAFPDPTISDVVGSAMVAAGLIQEGIKRQTLHIEDVQKTFQNTFQELKTTKESFRV